MPKPPQYCPAPGQFGAWDRDGIMIRPMAGKGGSSTQKQEKMREKASSDLLRPRHAVVRGCGVRQAARRKTQAGHRPEQAETTTGSPLPRVGGWVCVCVCVTTFFSLSSQSAGRYCMIERHCGRFVVNSNTATTHITHGRSVAPSQCSRGVYVCMCERVCACGCISPGCAATSGRKESKQASKAGPQPAWAETDPNNITPC
jgi:hypothetical protein